MVSSRTNTSSRLNLDSALIKFQLYLRRNGRSSSTIEAYTRSIHQAFDHASLSRLDHDKLESIALRLIETFELNSNRMRFAAINIFCREILGRPDLKLKIPKSKKRNTDILTSEQVELILEYAKTKRKSFYAVVLLLYECALRRNEVCSLNIDDIHFESKEIYLRATKTGDHIVTMTSRVSEAIKEYITNERTTLHEAEPALLVNNRGTRIGEHFVRDTLKRYAVAVGITHRVYPHILRASCITHLLNRGVNPKTVQAHARHSDFQTTMLYNRPTQQQMREDIQRCFTQPARDDTKKNNLYLEQYCRGEISGEEFLQLLGVPPQKQQKRSTTEPVGYL